eukprot:432744-Alexandrium_andersonii.AAC.1
MGLRKFARRGRGAGHKKGRAARLARAFAYFGRHSSGKQGPRQSGHVAFTEAPDDSSECKIAGWSELTKSVRGKVEAKLAMQCARAGRPADQRPWYDQRFSAMIALRNAQE